ncbi:MAG: NADPH:quinone reductase [Deltaproteobacteria bacterium]|nr:NADPH:quinone reductase [Deltaproteobacteria bacterium]
MRAIRVHEFGEPEVLRLEEAPEPKPGSGQVLVKVYAIGVNPYEAYMRAGFYLPPPLPFTPGHDAAGVVEAVGPEVQRVAVGDRVYTSGTLTGAYAEKTLCPEARVHPLPPNISFPQGAAIYVPYSAAYRALFQKAKALPGEVVLVHGASGGVGLAAVQLARAAGLTVIGTGGTDAGRRLAAENGAHHVLDHGKDGYLQEVMKITVDRGVDVIVELLANVNLGKDLEVLAAGGRVAVIGSRGTVTIDPRHAMAKEGAILGLNVWAVTEKEFKAIHAALGAGLANGTLKPVVGRELPLAEAAKAHRDIMEKKAYGKIVLIP